MPLFFSRASASGCAKPHCICHVLPGMVEQGFATYLGSQRSSWFPVVRQIQATNINGRVLCTLIVHAHPSSSIATRGRLLAQTLHPSIHLFHSHQPRTINTIRRPSISILYQFACCPGAALEDPSPTTPNDGSVSKDQRLAMPLRVQTKFPLVRKPILLSMSDPVLSSL